MFRKSEKMNHDAQTPERRRASSDTFRVGRTIAGDAQRQREEKMARTADRKKRRAKNIAIVVIVVALLLAVIGFLICKIVSIINQQNELNRPAEVLEPSVSIVDENAGDNVSKRAKDFVARLENDMSEYDLAIDRVILPYQKVRELDVYIKGRTEYYKLSLDRGSAVQAEDVSRMVLYLDSKEIKPEYVDLRVEGRAYYK